MVGASMPPISSINVFRESLRIESVTMAEQLNLKAIRGSMIMTGTH